MKMKLNQVQAADLNGTCLTIISQFSRALKAHNGKVLRLTDPDVVKAVVRHARGTSSEELRRLCHILLVEIKAYMNGEKSSGSQFSVYKKVENGGSKSDTSKGHRRV